MTPTVEGALRTARSTHRISIIIFQDMVWAEKAQTVTQSLLIVIILESLYSVLRTYISNEDVIYLFVRNRSLFITPLF